MQRRLPYKIRTAGFYFKVLLLNVVCLFLIIKIIKFIQEPEIILGKYDDANADGIAPFESILKRDFPTLDLPFPRIPRVIHQTWKNENIPSEFHYNIRSFVNKNPEFKYYFWTDRTARKLIRKKYPRLLETFDNVVEPVRKADILRYVVLYEYGGVYADLDTECLKPLDNILYKYACVISPEPYEHASLIYNTEFLVTNSIMFCRQNHPFLKRVIDSLPEFSHFSQDIDATGPNFLTYQYKKYMSQFHSKHNAVSSDEHLKRRFHKQLDDTRTNDAPSFALVDDSSDDFVYVPSSQYFQNELDPVRFSQFREMCENFETLNNIGKRGCVSLKFRGMKSRTSAFAYTRHSFFHTGYKWIAESEVSVKDLVKKVIL